MVCSKVLGEVLNLFILYLNDGVFANTLTQKSLRSCTYRLTHLHRPIESIPILTGQTFQSASKRPNHRTANMTATHQYIQPSAKSKWLNPSRKKHTQTPLHIFSKAGENRSAKKPHAILQHRPARPLDRRTLAQRVDGRCVRVSGSPQGYPFRSDNDAADRDRTEEGGCGSAKQDVVAATDNNNIKKTTHSLRLHFNAPQRASKHCFHPHASA